MRLRALLVLVLLTVSAAILLVLFNGPNQNSTINPGELTISTGSEHDPAELTGTLNDDSSTGIDLARTELSAVVAARLATSQRIGIPAFHGRVVMPDGKPATKAEVTAFGMDGWAMWMDAETANAPDTVRFTTTCGDDGSFSLPEAPRDGLRFILRARHGNLPPLELVNLPAVPGRTRELGDLRLRLGFALSGMVIGPGGEAVPMAKVFPVQEPDTANFSARRRLALPRIDGYVATTDHNGIFTFLHLPPGMLHLEAEAESYSHGYSESVHGEDRTEVDSVQIQLELSSRIGGTVLGPGGEPIAGARLRLDISNEERIYTASDSGGKFGFDAPRDLSRPSLRAYAVGYHPWRDRLSETTGNLVIQLSPLPPITGVVLDQTGQSIGQANVRLVELHSRRTPQENPERIASSGDSITNENGGFSLIPDLRSTWGRRFRLVAWSDQYVPSWSKSFEFKEMDTKPLPHFELVLMKGSTISGSVATADGNPAIGARVHLRTMLANRSAISRGAIAPDSRRPGNIRAAATVGATGLFDFSAIAVGDYRLEAYLPGHSPAFGVEFALLGGIHQEHLQLQPSSRIYGSVIGDLNLFGTLRVTASSPAYDDLHTTVDGTGVFEFKDLPAGSWGLVLREVDRALSGSVFGLGSGEGLARADGIDLAPGTSEIIELQIDISGRALLTGMVTVNGQPATNINLFLMPRDLGITSDPRLSWRRISRSLRSAVTDFRGEYRFIGVDPDDYWIVLDRGGTWPEGLVNFGDPNEVRNGPSGLMRRDLTLEANREQRQDFNLHLGTIRGKALSVGGKGNRQAIRGGRGTATSATGTSMGIASRTFDIRRNGNFEIKNLPAGEWLLNLYNSTYSAEKVPVLVHGNNVTETKVDCVRRKRKNNK